MRAGLVLIFLGEVQVAQMMEARVPRSVTWNWVDRWNTEVRAIGARSLKVSARERAVRLNNLLIEGRQLCRVGGIHVQS